MAGHSAWKNIKHRKAAVDAKRGRIWSKLSRAIIVAARNGGSDTKFNATLRLAVLDAKAGNMPRDTIERAIQKGAFGSDTESYENVRYECYGPGGVAIIVDALTNNRTRTITDVRNAFTDYGGNVGSTGCVAYMFHQRGQVVIEGKGLTEEKVMETAIEAGAVDVQAPDDPDEPIWTLLCVAHDFGRFKPAIDAAKFTIVEAGLVLLPDTSSVLAGENAKNFLDLVETLEDLDDVQKVWSNAQINEAIE